MRWMMLALLLVALVGTGCDSSSDPFNQPKRQVQPEMVNVTIDPGVPAAPPPPPPAATSEAATASSETKAPPPPPPPPANGETTETPPAPPAENTVRQEAQMGVGKKGRGYGGGLVTTPVAAYFGARERIAFQIQIPEAMKLYKALNGSAPKSHEEFMQKIIKENAVNLPELPEGHRYVYDPSTEQLMVESPK